MPESQINDTGSNVRKKQTEGAAMKPFRPKNRLRSSIQLRNVVFSGALMKNKLFASFVALALLSTLDPQLSTFAQGTAFTYQGRLDANGVPAKGSYDLQFVLYAAASGGSSILSLQRPATSVSNGLFTVSLDYGANFPGAARWLEIAVTTNR